MRNLLQLLLLSFCFTAQPLFAQSFSGAEIRWDEFKKPNLTGHAHDAEPLVILDEVSEFRFFSGKNAVSRLLTVKVNTPEGLKKLESIVFPESFDPVYDQFLSKQGRASGIKIPFIWEFKVKEFAARRLGPRAGNLSVSYKYQKTRWIDGNGAFVNEEQPVFQLAQAKVGDIVQIYSECQFSGSYGSGQYYFHSLYPKKRVEYIFTFDVEPLLAGHMHLAPINIPDSNMKSSDVKAGEKVRFTYTLTFHNLVPLRHPANTCAGKVLPHVYLDFGYVRAVVGEYSSSGLNQYTLVKPKRFEWLILSDTNDYFTRIYVRHFADLRKFVATLPRLEPGGDNTDFFRALCDTLNSFRYITRNHLFYNENHLYDVRSTDHLLRRRLVGSSYTLCRDILNDNHVTYYLANVQDRRLGEHSIQYRVHPAYEYNFFAIPNKGGYLYFLPRPNGVSYHLNELPFYLEGSLGALLPKNLQKNDSAKASHFYRYIKTHKGTFNENTRTENASVDIDIRKKAGAYSGKSSLSGQFSTVLRHFYLRHLIDSTIAPRYFVRSVDKPSFTEKKVSLSSKMEEFPFRYNFKGTAGFNFAVNSVSLGKWLAVPLDLEELRQPIDHEYQVDFDFSDIYNFQINFSEPVTIANSDSFNHNLDNAYFFLESKLQKISDTQYLFQAKVQVKKQVFAPGDFPDLKTFVAELDALTKSELVFQPL